MHPLGSVRVIQVFNNRNHHKSQVEVVHVRLIEVSVRYRFFLQ